VSTFESEPIVLNEPLCDHYLSGEKTIALEKRRWRRECARRSIAEGLRHGRGDRVERHATGLTDADHPGLALLPIQKLAEQVDLLLQVPQVFLPL
jgi:hypothetical protein